MDDGSVTVGQRLGQRFRSWPQSDRRSGLRYDFRSRPTTAMRKVKAMDAETISSRDGRTRIEAIERDDGNYSLRKFEKRYDTEENVSYEVECLSFSSGIYGSLKEALQEARRLILL